MEISNQNIKQIGMSQRAICLWILIVIIIFIASRLLIPQLIYITYIGPLIVIPNVWKMSKGFGNGTTGSVILCILLLVPLIGIITLIAMSFKASGILKKAGLHVGLLGAPKAELDNLN